MSLAEKVASLDEVGDQLYGAIEIFLEEALQEDFDWNDATSPVKEAMAEFSRVRTEVNS